MRMCGKHDWLLTVTQTGPSSLSFSCSLEFSLKHFRLDGMLRQNHLTLFREKKNSHKTMCLALQESIVCMGGPIWVNDVWWLNLIETFVSAKGWTFEMECFVLNFTKATFIQSFMTIMNSWKVVPKNRAENVILQMHEKTFHLLLQHAHFTSSCRAHRLFYFHSLKCSTCFAI